MSVLWSVGSFVGQSLIISYNVLSGRHNSMFLRSTCFHAYVNFVPTNFSAYFQSKSIIKCLYANWFCGVFVLILCSWIHYIILSSSSEAAAATVFFKIHKYLCNLPLPSHLPSQHHTLTT